MVRPASPHGSLDIVKTSVFINASTEVIAQLIQRSTTAACLIAQEILDLSLEAKGSRLVTLSFKQAVPPRERSNVG